MDACFFTNCRKVDRLGYGPKAADRLDAASAQASCGKRKKKSSPRDEIAAVMVAITEVEAVVYRYFFLRTWKAGKQLSSSDFLPCHYVSGSKVETCKVKTPQNRPPLSMGSSDGYHRMRERADFFDADQ